MYWRFFSIDDPTVSLMISRDTDSLTNPRDYAAVSEWLDSGKKMHLMHDCRAGHFSPVMGGMWGIKKPLDFSMTKKVYDFCEDKNFKFRYGQDQTFLTQKILPLFVDDSIDHHFDISKSKSSFALPWPKHEAMEIGSFVGERISFSALEITDLSKNNIDSDKLFLMSHQGKNDFSKIKDLIGALSNKYKEIVIPCKFGIEKHLKSLFGNYKNILYKIISSDIDGTLLYKDEFSKSHKYIGLGNHGVKVPGSGFNPKRCYQQCDLTEPKDIEKGIKIPLPKSVPKKHLEEMPLVSVVIGTFNRWSFLEKAIESAKNQTYKNIEIIVVNDGSTDPEYFKSLPPGVVWINLPKNSKASHGFRCRSYTYNHGIKIAKGKYLAFLDDDDAWFPEKIEKQILAMDRVSSGMSCTEAVQGRGLFDPNKKYKVYMGGIERRFKKWNVNEKLKDSKGFSYTNTPTIWTKEILSIHNFCIGSSVVLDKSLFEKVGYMNESIKFKKGQDYELWKRVLSITDCAFINEPLTYYDHGHGKGRQY
jgi:GT2 family glycosyltransferase